MRNKKLVFENSLEATNINISALKIINVKKTSFLYSKHANNVQAILSLIKNGFLFLHDFQRVNAMDLVQLTHETARMRPGNSKFCLEW